MSSVSTNIQRRAGDNSESQGDETPQLELRKPGPVFKEVEVPTLRLNVRPKVQVRDNQFSCLVGFNIAGHMTVRPFLYLSSIYFD